MDESVDAYVPSKAIPQTVLMDVYGEGGLRSQGSREANLSCFEIGVDRGDPIGISARLYRFPTGSEDPRCSLFPNLTARKGK